MSTDNIQAFLDHAELPENGKAIEAHLKAAGADDREEAMVDVANRMGFDFTLSEFMAFMRARVQEQASRIEDGELSEAELDAVAGGAGMGCNWAKWPWC